MTTFQAQHLDLSYENNPIVGDLSLTIPAGRITALVGPNGSGKSTLLRGMSRLLKPVGGSVLLDGQDIWKMPTKELARSVGILPQSPVAPEGLTVYELVAQGRYPHQTWLKQWSREDEQATREALCTTDMCAFADRPVDSLSGGQRQRAWIAMTLAQDTDLILLDEPTTYLDMAYQIEVLDLLHDLNVERGKTIVMVLHDLNQACRYADCMVCLRGGRIVAQGTPQMIVDESLVFEVFGLNSRVVCDPVTDTPMVVPIGKRDARRCSPASVMLKSSLLVGQHE